MNRADGKVPFPQLAATTRGSTEVNEAQKEAMNKKD